MASEIYNDNPLQQIRILIFYRNNCVIMVIHITHNINICMHIIFMKEHTYMFIYDTLFSLQV